MRWGSVWLAIGVAQIATSAPLPLVLKERLDVISDNLDGPVTILRARYTRHFSPATPLPTINRDKFSQTPVEITTPPSHPIDPVFLPRLSKHTNPKALPSGHEPVASDQFSRTLPEDEEVLEVSEAEIEAALSSFARPGMPCTYARQPREGDDMLIIYLAASFLLVVVTVETWGSYKRRRQGAIRLGEEGTSPQPQSVRADPEVAEELLDEKQDVLRL